MLKVVGVLIMVEICFVLMETFINNVDKSANMIKDLALNPKNSIQGKSNSDAIISDIKKTLLIDCLCSRVLLMKIFRAGENRNKRWIEICFFKDD